MLKIYYYWTLWIFFLSLDCKTLLMSLSNFLGTFRVNSTKKVIIPTKIIWKVVFINSFIKVKRGEFYLLIK